MRILTRGRLVPRQPRAIKRTTRTELHHCNIHHDAYIHWDIVITPTALRRYNIRNGRYIHWNFATTLTALRITTFITANGLIRDIDMVDNER